MIQLDSINKNEVVVGIAAANKNAGGPAAAAGLADFHSGNATKNFKDAFRIPILDFLLGSDAGGCTDLLGNRRSERRGDNDLVLNGADFEMEAEGLRFSAAEIHFGRTVGEPNEASEHSVASFGQPFEAIAAFGIGNAVFDGGEPGKERDARVCDRARVRIQNLALKSGAVPAILRGVTRGGGAWRILRIGEKRSENIEGEKQNQITKRVHWFLRSLSRGS